MPKKTMIAKICPTCKQQVPVACKSCPCGHFFYNARRIAREFAIEADYRRRTARVRREKPNYYDALEYDKHIKKNKKYFKNSKMLLEQTILNFQKENGAPKKECLVTLLQTEMKKRISECDNEDEEDKKENGKSKKKKIKKEEDEEDEVLTKLTPELQQHCQLILDQINMKLQMVTWKPA